MHIAVSVVDPVHAPAPAPAPALATAPNPAAPGTLQPCAFRMLGLWYAAFGKCEYELHKSSRAALFATAPKPHRGPAPRKTLQAKALRLFGFVLGVDSLKMQTDKKISGGPLALKRVVASPSPCGTLKEIGLAMSRI